MKFRHVSHILKWMLAGMIIFLLFLGYQNWYLFFMLDSSPHNTNPQAIGSQTQNIDALLSLQLNHGSLNSNLRGQLTDSIKKLKDSYEKDIEAQLTLISELQEKLASSNKIEGKSKVPLPRNQPGSEKPMVTGVPFSLDSKPIEPTQPPIAKQPLISTKVLGADTTLLIIASNRHEYLKRTLSKVVQYHPRNDMPVVISEDGQSNAMQEVIENAGMQLPSTTGKTVLYHWNHPVDRSKQYENGYFKLADHFKWALSQVFLNPECKRVIILEEDIEIAPDFFEFFAAVAPMLDKDSTLLAASAWNDNGMGPLVLDNKQLYRSDFFPGLGWMMSRRIWEELAPKWPRAYWDDWLREPKQRQERNILRPEISRSFHFGTRGVSNAEFGNFLSDIKLNNEFVPFTSMDLSYLDKEKWDREYISAVKSAPLVTRFTFNPSAYKEVRIEYGAFDGPGDSFVSLAHWSGVMDNIKANVPRTAYHGIVSFWKDGVKVHLAPHNIIA